MELKSPPGHFRQIFDVALHPYEQIPLVRNEYHAATAEFQNAKNNRLCEKCIGLRIS